MIVTFDRVQGGYEYPLSRTQVRDLITKAESLYPKLTGLVRAVRCGCNWSTGQEGRIVRGGGEFTVRLNFCVRDGSSPVLSVRESWLRPVRFCGGEPDLSSRQVRWSKADAARYASFILLHEIAHIVYMLKHDERKFAGAKGSPSEEAFCNAWAKRALEESY